MGNKSVTSAIPVISSTATAPTPTTTTVTSSVALSPTPTIPTTTVTTTTTTPSITTPTTTASPVTPTTNVAATITAKPTISIATTDTTSTTNVTTTTPTPTITSTAPITKEPSTASTFTTGTSKPDFFSVVTSAITDAEKTKSPASSAYTQWYKWTKFEQQKREKGKIPWYMGSPTTSTDTPSATTTTMTMTTAKIGGDHVKSSQVAGITVAPSFQLRSTAVYSPPHGDRILPGRGELINTDTSVFKYLQPDTQLKPTTGMHTKATMYRMNTRLKQGPLPTQSTPSVTTNHIGNINVIEDNTSLPTFTSRGQQTDLEASSKIFYYENQQPQTVLPVSALTTEHSGNNGFYHLRSTNANSQPVLAPIEKTPVWINDQPRSSLTQPAPSGPPLPLPPPSILKKSSIGLSQETPNPLSTQTHAKVLEELRKRNKTTKDGTYRVKNIHILEKNEPENSASTVKFNLLPSQLSSKASQSISRSEKLLFG